MSDEYAQIQTYATCNERTYAIVATHYRRVLEQLGCTNTQVLTWLDNIHWPDSEDEGLGDVYAAPFTLAPLQEKNEPRTIECAGIEVSLYLSSPVPSSEEIPVWVGFNLLFDTEILHEHDTDAYSAKVGPLLWAITLTQAGAFRELGAYLTNGWQENQPWRAIAAQMGNPWDFDLAVFPRSKASYFSEVPSGYKGTVTPQGFAFAQENRWQQLPWDV